MSLPQSTPSIMNLQRGVSSSSSPSALIGSETTLFALLNACCRSGGTRAPLTWIGSEPTRRSQIRVLMGLRPELDRRLRDAAGVTGLSAAVILGRIVSHLAHQMKRALRGASSFPSYFDEDMSAGTDESTRFLRHFTLRSDEDTHLRRGASMLGMSPYAAVDVVHSMRITIFSTRCTLDK